MKMGLFSWFSFLIAHSIAHAKESRQVQECGIDDRRCTRVHHASRESVFLQIQTLHNARFIKSSNVDFQQDDKIGMAPESLIRCGSPNSNMTLKYVVDPWKKMDEVVKGARNLEDCAACAKSLEAADWLRPGWQCKHVTNWLWQGSYNIQHPADNKLGPLKPLQSFNFNDVTAAGPILVGTAPLPQTLRGIFWLADPEKKSALMSFGGPNGDAPGWCSTGKLHGTKYRIRVAGDRSWAFAAPTSLPEAIDLIYNFEFDDASSPTFAHVLPETHKYGFTLTHDWLLDFDMELLDNNETEYPNSVVWLRKSYLLGSEVVSRRYMVIQVIDENGKRIEPAWSKFVDHQQNNSVGDPHGKLWFYGDQPLAHEHSIRRSDDQHGHEGEETHGHK